MTKATHDDRGYPVSIDISDDVHAVLCHKHYLLRFPFDPDAVEAVKSRVSAAWFRPGRCWTMDAHRHVAVRNTLLEIQQILDAKRHEVEVADLRDDGQCEPAGP